MTADERKMRFSTKHHDDESGQSIMMVLWRNENENMKLRLYRQVRLWGGLAHNASCVETGEETWRFDLKMDCTGLGVRKENDSVEVHAGI